MTRFLYGIYIVLYLGWSTECCFHCLKLSKNISNKGSDLIPCYLCWCSWAMDESAASYNIGGGRKRDLIGVRELGKAPVSIWVYLLFGLFSLCIFIVHSVEWSINAILSISIIAEEGVSVFPPLPPSIWKSNSILQKKFLGFLEKSGRMQRLNSKTGFHYFLLPSL